MNNTTYGTTTGTPSLYDELMASFYDEMMNGVQELDEKASGPSGPYAELMGYFDDSCGV